MGLFITREEKSSQFIERTHPPSSPSRNKIESSQQIEKRLFLVVRGWRGRRYGVVSQEEQGGTGTSS
jgi:hypothetical protein